MTKYQFNSLDSIILFAWNHNIVSNEWKSVLDKKKKYNIIVELPKVIQKYFDNIKEYDEESFLNNCLNEIFNYSDCFSSSAIRSVYYLANLSSNIKIKCFDDFDEDKFDSRDEKISNYVFDILKKDENNLDNVVVVIGNAHKDFFKNYIEDNSNIKIDKVYDIGLFNMNTLKEYMENKLKIKII